MFKGRQFDRSVILLCVRWYLAYGLSLRDLEEMMAERGIAVDHATIHRWVVRYSPELLQRFNLRKRAVTGKWHMDETYIKVRGRWTYLYRAIDSVGDTVEFHFSERDAARVDGLKEWQIFLLIYVPVMRSTYAAAFIIVFMMAWNMYLWPLIILQTNEMKTITLVVSSLASAYYPDYGVVMVGAVLATLPTLVVFFAMQRQFVQGLLGSVK
jgi:hypothetical protein